MPSAKKTTKTSAPKLDLAEIEVLLEDNRPSDALKKLTAARTKNASAWFLTGEAQRQLVGDPALRGEEGAAGEQDFVLPQKLLAEQHLVDIPPVKPNWVFHVIFPPCCVIWQR